MEKDHVERSVEKNKPAQFISDVVYNLYNSYGSTSSGLRDANTAVVLPRKPYKLLNNREYSHKTLTLTIQTDITTPSQRSGLIVNTLVGIAEAKRWTTAALSTTIATVFLNQ